MPMHLVVMAAFKTVSGVDNIGGEDGRNPAITIPVPACAEHHSKSAIGKTIRSVRTGQVIENIPIMSVLSI